MKEELIYEIQRGMNPFLDDENQSRLSKVLLNVFKDKKISQFEVKEFNPERNKELLNLFLESKKLNGCNIKSLNYYESNIIKLLDSCNKNLRDITPNDIISYLVNFKQEKDCSDITLDNFRRIFSTFFGWLVYEQYIDLNPCDKIKRLHYPSKHTTCISLDQFHFLKSNLNTRDNALLSMLYYTGITVNELVNLDINDVDIYNREVNVKGKNKRNRSIRFTGECNNSLMEYLQERKDNNPALFVSLKKPHKRLGINGVEVVIRELGKKVNFPNLTPHTFRKARINYLQNKGVPLEQIQKELGYTNIQTMERYIEME